MKSEKPASDSICASSAQFEQHPLPVRLKTDTPTQVTLVSGRDQMIRWILSCATQFNARRDAAGIAELFQEGATKQWAVWRAPEGLDVMGSSSSLVSLAVEPPHRRKTALNLIPLRQAEQLESSDLVHYINLLSIALDDEVA